MGLHHITWRATASALSNVDVIAEALEWLVGDDSDLEIDRSTSYHGPELVMLKAATSNKRKAMRSFARIGEVNLKTLADEFDKRKDDENILHFRLTLDSLLLGAPKLADTNTTGTVKGQAKFEAYSGRDTASQFEETLVEAMRMAREDAR